MDTTSDWGLASLTPRAAGTSYPMQENAYSTWYWTGVLARHRACRSPGMDPAALTTTSSSPNSSLRAPKTSVWAGSGPWPRW